MEELIRLIDNFEYDQRKKGSLTEELMYFLADAKRLIEEDNRSLEWEYERGKQDGYDEAENELGYDESLVDDLHKAKELIDDAISSLERW